MAKRVADRDFRQPILKFAKPMLICGEGTTVCANLDAGVDCLL
jgi:hypothetical protein